MNSVVKQTFQNFELIIVDDGSIDNTKEFINSFLQNKNIYYKYYFQENSGPSVARNKAVKFSKGQYIAFIDSDDEWVETKLEIQYNQIKKLQAKFLGCRYTVANSQINFTNRLLKYNFKKFLISNRTSTPCTVISKELFDLIGGFDESMSYSEDYNLWLKASKKEVFYFYDFPLVILHKKAYGESGLSANMWEMEKGELKNYCFFYKKGSISTVQLILLIVFSLLKYLKRRFIV